MTRHTRNRQLERYNPEYFILTIGNIPVEYVRKELMDEVHLDPTFKWVRTKRHNFIYDDVNGITEYLVDKNVISWTKVKPNGVFRSNMNPKGSSVMTYRIGVHYYEDYTC